MAFDPNADVHMSDGDDQLFSNIDWAREVVNGWDLDLLDAVDELYGEPLPEWLLRVQMEFLLDMLYEDVLPMKPYTILVDEHGVGYWPLPF